ncbi:MAG: hypothetical protein C4K60_12690 [Ideonella sp. MAG2]|nr:MAG: hypothetical protein C4K60_12690 [Ideonella sp. MAG2]
MIINHTGSFVFVHVPKAAGTSISRLFTRFSTYRDLEVGGTPLGEAVQPFFKRRFGLAKHSTAQEIESVMGAQRFGKYFTFAFVRNPYTRAFSIFNYLHRQQDRKTLKTVAAVSSLTEFGAFVRSEYFAGDGMDRILRPQTFWTDLAAGQALDFVGSVEAIDADVAYVLRHTVQSGSKAAHADEYSEVQARNRSTDNPNALWELLRQDPEAEQLIFDRYQSDFERFGYERLNMTATVAYDERRLRDRGDQPHLKVIDIKPALSPEEDAAAGPLIQQKPGGKKGGGQKHGGKKGPGAKRGKWVA